MNLKGSELHALSWCNKHYKQQRFWDDSFFIKIYTMSTHKEDKDTWCYRNGWYFLISVLFGKNKFNVQRNLCWKLQWKHYNTLHMRKMFSQMLNTIIFQHYWCGLLYYSFYWNKLLFFKSFKFMVQYSLDGDQQTVVLSVQEWCRPSILSTHKTKNIIYNVNWVTQCNT